MKVNKYITYSSISDCRSLLMGIAMLSVIVKHSFGWAQLKMPSGITFLTDMLFTDAFLFLSGFGIAFSLSKNSDTKDFYKRRISRLLLPFMIMAFPFYVLTDLVQDGDIVSFLLDETTLYNVLIRNNGMWYIAASFIMYTLAPYIYNVINKSNNKLFATILLCIPFIGFDTYIHLCMPEYAAGTAIIWDKLWMFVLGMFVSIRMIESKNRGGILLILSVMTYVLFTVLKQKFDFLTCYQVQSKQIFFILLISNMCVACMKYSAVVYIKSLIAFFGKYSLELYVLHMLLVGSLMQLAIMVYGTFLPPMVIRLVPFINIIICLTICKPVHEYTILLAKKMLD